MITVGMNYQVIPGEDEQFVAVFAKVRGVIESMPGHSKTNLFRDVFDEHAYLIVSEWSDEASFQAFIKSDRFRNVVDWGKENILAGRPVHTVYGASAGT